MKIVNLSERIEELSQNIFNLSNTVNSLEIEQRIDVRNLDMAWLLICTFLVFFMQTGFMMLETGGVARKILYESIILKNMISCSISAIVFYLLGYGLAFGNGGTAIAFSGANYFALTNNPPLHNFFWQWAFLSASTTIPSGAMAERTRLRSHCYWVLLARFIVYPLCAHWIWSVNGWLSPWRNPPLFGNGVLDFAGSGVIHLLGGTAGVVGAVIAGPRVGRYEDKYERKLVFLPQNIGEMSLGTFILWFSWYGFNCGSTITLSAGRSVLAGKVAVNTTISASMGGIIALLLIKFRTKKWSLSTFLNGVLSGLVAITAGCAYVETWASLIIGFFAGCIYYWANIVEAYFRIDDVIEVGPVHMANGFWGLIAVGLFCTQENIEILYRRDTSQSGLFVGGGAMQLGIQLLASIIIIIWSFFLVVYTFLAINEIWSTKNR
jgi:Amt family ammonium transporter